MGKGWVLVQKQVVEGRGHFFRASVNDSIVSDGFLLSLSMCTRGFHDLLRVRPSSLLMLCGCTSWVSLLCSTPMKMEWLVSSETSAIIAQMPGDYPKDTIQVVSRFHFLCAV